MAHNLQVDQTVQVPAFLIPEGDRLPYSMYSTSVVEVVNRSVRVRLPGGGAPSELIAASKIHSNIAIAIVSIGDFATEDSLITPLTKSVLQFCRLLLPDDQITSLKLRALGELGKWWSVNHGAYSHVVLIGHGSRNGITFGVGGERNAELFSRRLSEHSGPKKTFISLCCETGRNPFAGQFSRLPFCGWYMAPLHSIHGAVASHFLQSFFSLHLLKAESTAVAFRHANAALPTREGFRLWRAGALVKGKAG